MSRRKAEDSEDNKYSEDEYPVHPVVVKRTHVLLPRNREGGHGGSQSATEAGARVWPPTLLGRRKVGKSLTEPYVDVNPPKLIIPSAVYVVSPSHARFRTVTIDSIKHAHFPIFVFPPSAEGYIRAIHFDGNQSAVRVSFPMLTPRWTLKYATVRDMIEIDPHKKLVGWSAMSSSYPAISKGIFNNNTISMIGTPKCLSALQNEDFQAKIRNMNDAQISLQRCVDESMDAENFAFKLESLLDYHSMSLKTEDLYHMHRAVAHASENAMLGQFQEREKSLKNYLADITSRQSHTRNAFAFNGVHFANASFERLNSLGALMGGAGEMPDRAGNMFTSRIINRGTEVELRALQSTEEEIRRATTNKKKLTQLELDLLESTGKLMVKQNKEIVKHLLECATKSQIIMEEDMMSRVELMKSLRQAEEKVSVLQKFVSAGATEIAEEVYSDALKERDQEHAAALSKFGEAKSNQECCICYHELDGFSLSSNHSESSSSKKLHKRACFLPCMHANVCATCSEKRWNEGPKECPICRQQLTEKPRVIYL